jgi:GWxTD domain-containing protein
MSVFSRHIARGHRALFSALAVTAVFAGCAAGPSRDDLAVGQPGTAEETLNELFNLTGLYQRIGRIAAGPPISFVGQLAFLAGRGDSTLTLMGISLDNRTLAFQRSGRDFIARYRVEMAFHRPDQLPVFYARNEVVSVATFQETQRAEESVLFQQGFLLEPDVYRVAVTVRDPGSASFSQTEATVQVPHLGVGTTTAPILVYQATPRKNLWAEPQILLNPRGMVAHGDDSLSVYVEGYGFEGPRDVPFRTTDEFGKESHSLALSFGGGAAVEGHLFHLPADTPALGRLVLQVGEGNDSTKRLTALVSFSRSWALTNYDNLFSLLRYFGQDDRLDALRRAAPEERPALWRVFWKETDPNPNTADNEALDRYFTRIAIANQRFRDEGGATGGWRTDRGEVYVTLGEPDLIQETPPGNDQRYVLWEYNSYGTQLLFEGNIGFSRLRLTPTSRAEFARVRVLAQQRQNTRN